ncbi:MAG: alpha/beta fold hydrolase [Mycobacterium sp.]
MARPSAFRSDEARAAYCRLYDEAVALSEVAVEELEVDTSFGTTHVLTAGDPSKAPLVAFHAMAMGSTMWLPLLPSLTATRRVLMLDAVGDASKSAATAVLSSPARVIRWIDEALDGLDVDRGAVMGASIGTWIATQYAMARPDRVDHLALIGPSGIVSSQHTRWLLRSFRDVRLRPTRAKIEAFVDSLAAEMTRPRMRTDPWRPIVEQMIVGLQTFRRDLREPRPARCDIQRLASSGIPVLALIGRNETMHDAATMAQRLHRQLPSAQVTLIDDAKHLVFIDQQQIVADQLHEFLAS